MTSTDPDDPSVVLVTGGTGGLGSAICEAFAGTGASVAVGYRSSEARARQLVASLPGSGHGGVRVDVTDRTSLDAAARTLKDHFGGCDVLVNCAGTTRFVPHDDLQSLDDELADEILRTNVRGAFAAVRAMRALLDRSRRPGGGVVVSISSIAAVTAMGSNVMYCASKAALDNMTKSLARALAPSIRVVSVSPGLVDTEFVAGLDPTWRAEQEARTPLGRLATAAEIAAAVLAVADRLVFTTGSVIAVDGGRALT